MAYDTENASASDIAKVKKQVAEKLAKLEKNNESNSSGKGSK